MNDLIGNDDLIDGDLILLLENWQKENDKKMKEDKLREICLGANDWFFVEKLKNIFYMKDCNYDNS
jgi:hypothetical protein